MSDKIGWRTVTIPPRCNDWEAWIKALLKQEGLEHENNNEEERNKED